MKKEDLKYGNVVELQNGDKLIYIENNHKVCELEKNLIDLKNGEEWVSTDQYDENFNNIYINIDNFNIVKVYEDYTCKKVLWDRKKFFILTGDVVRKLEALKKLDFNYIVRDANDSLWVYVNEPNKKDVGWFSFGNVYKLDDNLFRFIKWEDEEPYLISDLLEVA